ncbi:metallophosphoesterase [uncultured Draconibacterium sp.]|uniref:metallophosphoesterase n=1 Tax=uncultured Draconibacterium sp. TaxID=1573823 RepID=UPI0025F82E1F|nr:metallophosphoesterase [uncultured Draconibacterium sp.]
MYDIIGDVHGYATLLKKLLLEMGYKKTNGSFSHESRKAIFVGDFINRGPEIRKTIRIIKAMVEAGHAYAVLGNHELNAIIYHLKDKQGRSIINKPSKYFLSLFKTINEYSAQSLEWRENLKWLRTLPLFLDFGEIRVVHACWSDQAIQTAAGLYEDGRLRKKVFRKVYKKNNSEEAKCVWLLTKGINMNMPSDLRVMNNKGVSPRSFRIKWWENLAGYDFRTASFESKFTMPAYTIPKEIVPATFPYPEDAPILFFGHYCRGVGPYLIKPNICCVDSCVTGTKSLLAYRWSGEKELNMNHLVKMSM